MSDSTKLGEQMGDFLRGLLRAPAPATPQATDAIAQRKWAVVDANEVSTGVMASLDLELDPSEIPGQLTRDPEANGLAHFSSGISTPLNVVIAKDYANALTLIPATQPGIWNLIAGPDTQPYGKTPLQVTFFQRLVPETDVIRIGGQLFDPNTNQRVNFSVTHDPIETVILAIVFGFSALICGGVVLHDVLLNAGNARAIAMCGEGNVQSVTIKRKYGFSWKSGGVDIGCGEDYIIECKQPLQPPILPPRRKRKP